MSRLLRITKYICISLGALFLLLVIGAIGLIAYATYEDETRAIKHIRSKIPSKIEVLDVVTKDIGWKLPGGFCNGASFRLSKKTLSEIKSEGILYFNGVVPSGETKYYDKIDHWREWREAPTSTEDAYDAKIPDGCLHNFENFLEKNKYGVHKKNIKAYYTYVTHRGSSTLWIFPELGIIFYSDYYS